MELVAYDNINVQGYNTNIVANIDFGSLRTEGKYYPTLLVRLQARASVASPHKQHSVQPTKIACRLYLGNESQPDNLIAVGDAEHRLGEWRNNYDEYVDIRFALTPVVIQHIARSLKGPYLPIAIEITGSALYKGEDFEHPFQFKNNTLRIKLSSSDWITQVLEPVGWGQYFVLNIPAPDVPNKKDYEKAMTELEKADNAFLTGDDDSVCSHSYKALEAFSKRPLGPDRVAGGDPDKHGAIQELIKAGRRFTNGPRHVSENDRRGSFAVDHIDAEYARAIATFTVGYLAKRLESHKT